MKKKKKMMNLHLSISRIARARGSRDQKGKGNQKSEKSVDPVEGDKCPVPGCSKTLSKGKDNHLYIVQCPMLKTQKTATLLNWFHQKGYKCAHCFSKDHSSSDCQFREFKCKRVIADKNGKPRYCGKSHHVALHDQKTDGQILPPNHDQFPKPQSRD